VKREKNVEEDNKAYTTQEGVFVNGSKNNYYGTTSYSDSIQSIAIGMDLMKIVPALNGILQELQQLKHENGELKDFVSKSISELGGAENWKDMEGIKEYLADPSEKTMRAYIDGTYGSPIPCHKVGNRLLFKPSEVDDWVKTWELSKQLSRF